MESGLASQSTYDHPLTTLPNDDRSDLGIFYPFVGHAWHIAVVEVDVETGKLEFLNYAAVHDAGTVVNPKTLDGQIIGGTIQGLGSALYEGTSTTRRASPQRGLRLLPPALVDGRAGDDGRAPRDAVAVHAVRDQGGGGGRSDADAAILSAAIEDALEPYGVQVTSLPISASRSWSGPPGRSTASPIKESP